jgi:multiple sugar transport system permease protein
VGRLPRAGRLTVTLRRRDFLALSGLVGLSAAVSACGSGVLKEPDVTRAPGMATTALYAFLAAWTEFLGALTFLTRQDLYTLPLSLVNLQQGAYGQVNYGFLAAGSVIAMVPCVILLVALQRFYVAGLSAGAVKG